MDQFNQRGQALNREVNSLLQQLVSSRGDPQVFDRLSPAARAAWNTAFTLSEEARKAGKEEPNVEDAKVTLRKYFARALENEVETWEEH